MGKSRKSAAVYEYCFLRFLDSSDVAEYNRNTVFTPAEQAVLICMSQSRTVAEKKTALEYLAATYADDEFGETELSNHDRLRWANCSFRDVVLSKIHEGDKLLEARYDNRGFIFAAALMEKGFQTREYDYQYFTEYDMAYQYLVKERQEYLDDEDLKDVPLYGEIKRIPLNNPDTVSTPCFYRLNNEMEIVDMWGNWEESEYSALEGTTENVTEKIPDLESDFYCHVPIPFKGGELLVEESYYAEAVYGILGGTYPSKENDTCLKVGCDSSDIVVHLDIYNEEYGKWYWTDDTSRLRLRYCTEQEKQERSKWIAKWHKMKEKT